MHHHSHELVPLRMDHAYLRGAPTSAYWSIAPHLIQQATDSSCSLATAVMLINAVRGRDGRLGIGKPASEASLLDTLNDAAWRLAVAQDGNGLSLTEFAAAIARALPAYGCGGKWNVAIAPVTDAGAAIPDLRAALTEMEDGAKRPSSPPISISICSMAMGSISGIFRLSAPTMQRATWCLCSMSTRKTMSRCGRRCRAWRKRWRR
jgi:hypothetical protein